MTTHAVGMSARISQAALAERLGLSQSWVSLALRGSRRVSAATRARVLAEAASAGYQPNPLLAAIAERRRGRPSTPPVIAWIGPAKGLYHAAIVRRCDALGYALWAMPRHDPQRLRQRRVVGVLMDAEHPATLDQVMGLPAVQVGVRRTQSIFAMVWPDVRAAVQLCLAQVRAAGFQRIHVIQVRAMPSIAGDLVEDTVQGEARRMGGITYQAWPWEDEAAAIAAALATRREVVVTNASQLADALIARRRPVAMITRPEHDRPYSGADPCYATVATVAVDLLDGRIRRGDLGLADHGQSILIPPRWLPGTSLG